MSATELRRYDVLVREKSNTEAAKELGLTPRHIRRLRIRAQGGVEALAHKARGKPSTRKVSETTVKQIQELLTSTYKGFGPTFAAEQLAKRNSITVSDEWLRKYMAGVGLWKAVPRKEREVHREWRERMAKEGTMEQFDGSYHRWFGGFESCLLASIDDATGRITRATFGENEGVDAVFTFWKRYAETGRLPSRIYVDKFSTYKLNHVGAVDEPELMTQFERACGELGVELVRAHSPQAKGRIERLFGTLQDRLVKELKLRGIVTTEAANTYLPEFIKEHNERFAVVPRSQELGFVSTAGKALHAIFSRVSERKAQMDFTIRYKNGWYQITKDQDSTVRSKDVVLVEERLDGTVYMRLKRTNRYLRIQVLPERPKNVRYRFCIPATTKTPYVPAVTHPWRKPFLPSQARRQENQLLTT